MCLILFAYRAHPLYKLIVAANRDEFYQRPTAPAHFWRDIPHILAGRDLDKMGTWMGVTQEGRFSALTNYRDPKAITVGKRSRGELVVDALKIKGNLQDYMQDLRKTNDQYPGYNLVAGDLNELYYYSNVGLQLQRIEPGIYGVSNHLLNTEWPKVRTGKEGMTRIIDENHEDIAEKLFHLLSNESFFQDELLPHSGVSLEWERTLSPLFIKSKNYGTRSSTVLLMSDQEIQYTERVFSNGGATDRRFTIKL
ncbi:NRDE family protein [Ferviditalea candida]|uniref:NRDE family protein n=1 Tax=Ferviditalea candida TaxID=3108399 RepID=A0ABU5ZHG7_9BACL|nr:NRDE family protein [Paenibacillaceae bacterium T2]